MIISRTPFRMSFFGGGTDYPEWYKNYGGAVLSTTFKKYSYVSCRLLPPFFEHKYRIAYSQIENPSLLSEIKHPAIKAVLENFEPDKGIEIHCDADLPARSGLGSSSSFVVGLLNAILALNGRRVTKKWLAEKAIWIEREVLGEVVGDQDQIAAAHGGLNYITFQKDGSYSVEPLVISPKRVSLLEKHLMLFYTGQTRIASTVAEDKLKNFNNESERLLRIRGMVEQARQVLYSEDDLREFGALMHDSWNEKRKLSSLVSNEKIDKLYKIARDSGAVGGKLLGAGGGGFMLLFVEQDKQNKVSSALSGLVQIPVTFEKEGSRIIYFDP